MSTALTESIPFTQIERMAVAAAKSGLFGVKEPDQALALMMIAQAEGMHPARAMQEYHVIKGRPALKADAMLARFQAAGGKVQWTEHTDKRVCGVFTHSAGGSIEIEWTIDRARAAGLTDKDNWRAYPRQMLRARCISEGVRAVFPGVSVGTYSAEETADMEPAIDVTPQRTTVEQAVADVATALTDEDIQSHMKDMDESGDMAGLSTAFASAWQHANQARDKAARDKFKAHYDTLKDQIGALEVMR